MTVGWVEIALDEYRTLRQEILQAIQAQQSIISYGMAAVGVLLGIASSVDETTTSAVLLLALMPIFSYLVLFIWLGEVARMMRAGRYLREIEAKISSTSGYRDEPPLYWETSLRRSGGNSGTPQSVWNYIAVISLFLLAALIAVIVGDVRIANKVEGLTLVWINLLEAVLLMVSVIRIYNAVSRFE